MHREDRYRFLRLGNSFKRRSPGFAFEEIANVDYRQLYLRLAYLEKDLPPPDRDLYLIPGFEDCRDGVKVLVNAMLFLAKPLDHWPRNTLVHFPKGTLLRDVRDAIMVAHWPIHDLFEKDGIGHRLAFIESQMLVHTLRRLWSSDGQRIPALPLHDSVLVARSNAEEAKAAMLAAWEHVTGVKPEQSWVSVSAEGPQINGLDKCV